MGAYLNADGVGVGGGFEEVTGAPVARRLSVLLILCEVMINHVINRMFCS